MRKKNVILFGLLSAAMLSLTVTGCGGEKEGEKQGGEVTQAAPTNTPDTVTPEPTGEPTPEPTPFEEVDINYKRVSVHDPSIIKADDTYYIFGSHKAWAKSKDLIQWTAFSNNINSNLSSLFGDIWEEWSKTATNPDMNGNMWAPDVIYNENMGKYCMYMSVNGDDWNSVITLLTADEVEGPYEYVGPVIYSGFNTTTHPAEKTDVYKVLGEGADLTRYQSTSENKLNAIDPCVKFDENGDMWMVYGSWFGGLYMIKLDRETGLRDYSHTYETVEDVSDAYNGIKIAGGHAVSGEAPYILKVGDYYYLFVSYGGLTAQGGYQMRTFRSESICGPYVDQNGVSAIYSHGVSNNLQGKVGLRIMSSYKLAGNFETHVAQGHNSAFVDDDGKIYVVYHTRFEKGKGGVSEAHEVRVQQLFVNEDGWLIAAPYEYSGESLPETNLAKEQMVGEYEFIIHNPVMYYGMGKMDDEVLGIVDTNVITLNEDGTVTGDFTGTWTYEEGKANMTITVKDVEYKGYFLRQATEGIHKVVTCFTAAGGNVCVWGSQK